MLSEIMVGVGAKEAIPIGLGVVPVAMSVGLGVGLGYVRDTAGEWH